MLPHRTTRLLHFVPILNKSQHEYSFRARHQYFSVFQFLLLSIIILTLLYTLINSEFSERVHHSRYSDTKFNNLQNCQNDLNSRYINLKSQSIQRKSTIFVHARPNEKKHGENVFNAYRVLFESISRQFKNLNPATQFYELFKQFHDSIHNLRKLQHRKFDDLSGDNDDDINLEYDKKEHINEEDENEEEHFSNLYLQPGKNKNLEDEFFQIAVENGLSNDEATRMIETLEAQFAEKEDNDTNENNCLHQGTYIEFNTTLQYQCLNLTALPEDTNATVTLNETEYNEAEQANEVYPDPVTDIDANYTGYLYGNCSSEMLRERTCICSMDYRGDRCQDHRKWFCRTKMEKPVRQCEEASIEYAGLELDGDYPCIWLNMNDTIDFSYSMYCSFQNLSDSRLDQVATKYNLTRSSQVKILHAPDAYPEYDNEVHTIDTILNFYNYSVYYEEENQNGTDLVLALTDISIPFTMKIWNFNILSDTRGTFKFELTDPNHLTNHSYITVNNGSMTFSELPEEFFAGDRLYAEAGVFPWETSRDGLSDAVIENIFIDFKDRKPPVYQDYTTLILGLTIPFATIIALILGGIFIGFIYWRRQNQKRELKEDVINDDETASTKQKSKAQ